MKQGELDFLSEALLSDGAEGVFMFSDMRVDDMAADAEFLGKYMLGLALLLKKGLRISVIHNLSRPFNEMMVGLKGWIPLYMTGLISPYYLKGAHNSVFCHSLNVSGAAALSGEPIAGFYAKGRYYLSADSREVAYYRERADQLLGKARSRISSSATPRCAARSGTWPSRQGADGHQGLGACPHRHTATPSAPRNGFVRIHASRHARAAEESHYGDNRALCGRVGRGARFVAGATLPFRHFGG